jgi:DNA polymerase-1
MVKNELYLIDATAFCYRAFYAIRGLATSLGQPTNAIYGFINILHKILKEKNPQFLAVCFDVSRDTFRQKKFAEYKIQRPPMPEGLTSQMPFIKEIISAYGIAVFEKEGYEADDIIATMAEIAKEEGLSVTIVSSDKDILQLVDEDTLVFSPYKDEGTLYDNKKVFERFGVTPAQIPDLISLMGDVADNIPNVPGIGEVSAVNLIKSFGSLDKLLDNLDQVKQDKLRDALNNNIATIRLNKELAILSKEVDLDFGLDKLKIGKPNYQELFRLFKLLEFKKLLKDLPFQQEEADTIQLNYIEDEDLKSLLDLDDELVLYGQNSKDLVFWAKNKFFCAKSIGTNLKTILSDPKIRKTGHDLKKIKVSLFKEGITLQGLYFDTMIASYLLNPSRPGYNLGDVALDHLDKIPSAKSIDNQRAIGLILHLRPKLEENLHDKSLFKLFKELEMPLVEVLAEMELVGIKLDLVALKKLTLELEKRLIKLIEEIYELSGCQFNINSPKQLRGVLFEKLKLPVVKKTKTGPSTDEEVLKNLAGFHKLPALLLEYRQLTKLKSTYIDALPELVDARTLRLHSSFNQAGTETGRLSSSNPNLQNIPIKTDIGKKIRQAIISSGKNHYLVSCDYSQIELRILAHISKDENLTLAFKKDKDIHKITASLIYGLDEDNITDEMREVAKRINFGIIYGLTPYGLSRDLNISQDTAGEFIDAYFLRYPRVKVYIEDQIKRAQDCGFVTTLLGRRRYIPEINEKNQAVRQFAQRKAINTPIQGSASDLVKLAMLEIHRQIKERKLKTSLILQVHDELVFDAPDEELAGLIPLVKDKMEHVLELDVPIRAVIKKGKNWLEMEEVK